ncbi:hypothetical protein ATANTOWER_016174 [Ataeniobius toweri]|uniref:Uncharacterized protein n=1 Tax=Ataeniobius toweri TaxID=208326 RepID=A0ABU7A784_9TELE|nr:hypothetical protein [Ataeniobius toweri]
MILVWESEFFCMCEIFPEQRISAGGCACLKQTHLSVVTSSNCSGFRELLADQTSPDDQFLVEAFLLVLRAIPCPFSRPFHDRPLSKINSRLSTEAPLQASQVSICSFHHQNPSTLSAYSRTTLHNLKYRSVPSSCKGLPHRNMAPAHAVH